MEYQSGCCRDVGWIGRCIVRRKAVAVIRMKVVAMKAVVSSRCVGWASIDFVLAATPLRRAGAVVDGEGGEACTGVALSPPDSTLSGHPSPPLWGRGGV